MSRNVTWATMLVPAEPRSVCVPPRPSRSFPLPSAPPARPNGRAARRLRRALAVLLAVPLLVPLAAQPSSAAPGTSAPAGAIFPSDSLTVKDPAQATGRRVALPLPDCAVRASDCHEIRLLNQLDGFDLDPRVAIAFRTPVDPASLTARDVSVTPTSGGPALGLNRLVWDAATNTLHGHPTAQLQPATTYRIAVAKGVGGSTGWSTTFTTMSAPRQLLQMRQQLDDGTAYTAAGIPAAQRRLDFSPGGTRAVFPAGGLTISRSDDRGSAGGAVTSTVLDTAGTGAALYAFGSFRSPSWLTADRVVPATPTGTGAPQVQGSEQVGVAVVVPAGVKPPGGWPVAVFGHGFTRSKLDMLLAADLNASRGIATVAMDVPGHGYGPGSTISVTSLTGTTTFPAFGRGFDQDGDGDIESTEGVAAPAQPHPLASIGNRDGLRQTVADLMALVRAVRTGVDVDGDGSTDLRGTGVSYYGQSFGGIYGTMLAAADPAVPVAALNVPGAPIIDIARLGAFRHLAAQDLGKRQPPLLNGGRDGFEESLPLYLDPPVTRPAPGALAIQDVFARVAWLSRPGSADTFAPLLRLRPPTGSPAKAVLYQYAYGDRTVPNPTSATLMRAGGLQDVTTVYRNDRTATAGSDPHSFLLNPTLTGRQQGQTQIVEFLASGGTRIVDPDGAGNVFEVPIADPRSIETLNTP